MKQNKNKQSKIVKMLIILSVVVFMFSASAKPTYAIFGIGDITFNTTIGDIPQKLSDIFTRIRNAAGARAFHQALRSVTYRLAQDTAVWLASGDKGRKPLIWQQPWDDALRDIGDEVGGKFLSNLSSGIGLNVCSPANLDQRLKLVVGVTGSFKDFDIFKDNDVNRNTGRETGSTISGATGCTFSDIGKNFQEVYESKKTALKDLSKGFDIDNNALGSFIIMREYLEKEKTAKERAEELARQNEFKAKTNAVTGGVETPASTIEKSQEIATQEAITPQKDTTGDIFVDAFQIFANTFAQTYLRRLQKGLINYRPTRSPGSFASDIEGSPASRAALLAEYNAFSPEKAFNVGGAGEIDLFSDMLSCPDNQYQTPYNCLLSDSLSQAVRQGITVRQAVDAGYIDPNMNFPEDHDPNDAKLSLENLKKLRFLRVIPVGWEIAAQKLKDNGARVKFSELLACFESAGTNCSYAYLNGLVDPGWILTLPEQYCNAKGYSSVVEHERSPNRVELCVDLRTCVSEDSSGKCSSYGYCARERNIFDLNGDKCEAQYATCTTFSRSDNSNFSVLTNSINIDGCSETGAAGCKLYSYAKNADGTDTWDTSKKIYLNSNALSCSASEAGASEFIPLMVGVNIVKNGNFAEDLVAFSTSNTSDEGEWNFINDVGYDRSSEIAKLEGANTNITQQIDLKPYTYYNLSFDIINFSPTTGDFGKVEITGIPNLIKSYSSSSYNNNRQTINFYSGAVTSAELKFSSYSGATMSIDNVQIIEINVKDVDAYSASAAPVFREYGYDSQRDLRQAFKNAQKCSAEESTARLYTLASVSSEQKTARLLKDGLCLAECDGMEKFLAMPTQIEKLVDPNDTADRLSFIPKYGQTCSQQDVGCEVFTNLSSSDGTERREYYNRIESCVMDTNPGASTFYTWEAGQLKSWYLLADSESGPCVNFPQGRISDPNTQSCQSGSTVCLEDGGLCRTFTNEAGVEFVRDANKIVTASRSCTKFRRTVEELVAGGTPRQESWYFIPSEANQCSPSALGCRQYKGKTANNVQTLFEEDFETGGYSNINDDSIQTGGHSINVSGELEISEDKLLSDGNSFSKNYSYEIKFIAKAESVSSSITNIFASGGGDHYFLQNAPKIITSNWREYTFGPMYWDNDGQPDNVKIQISGGDILIDNLEIRQINSNYYFIESSLAPQSLGGRQPNACFEGNVAKYAQCNAYKDANNNTYYVNYFDRLFKPEAISCIAVINTHNYSIPYSASFPQGADGSIYNVPADSLEYRYISAENNIALAKAGCSELGLANNGTFTSATSAYKIVDPDSFGSTMCKSQSVGCETFTSGTSDYVFREPGDDLCTWDPSFGNSGAWTKTNPASCTDSEINICTSGNSEACMCTRNESGAWIRIACYPEETKSCADSSGRSTKNSCTAYLPVNSNYTEGSNTVIYALANTVLSGDCGGNENIEVGCVNFKSNYSNPPEILSSKLSDFSERQTVLQVEQKRQCAEWLAPTTTSQTDDPKAKTKRTVVYDLGRCQQLGPNGNCVKWVSASNNSYPEAYRKVSGGVSGGISVGIYTPDKFNESDYQNRQSSGKNLFSGAWDYSGYSIPGQYPVEYLKDQGNSNLSISSSKLAIGSSNDKIEISCRAYPEEDSPFSREDIPPRTDYTQSVTYGQNSPLTSLNLCEQSGMSCDCSYRKIDAIDQTVYLPKNSEDFLPEETKSIASFEGWYGFCLEKDSDTKDPNNNEACLAWWPVDVVRDKPNVFDNHPEAGFVTSQPLYYCIAAKGNNIATDEQDGLYFEKAEDNNYVISVGALGEAQNNLAAYDKHFYRGFGWPWDTGESNGYKLLQAVHKHDITGDDDKIEKILKGIVGFRLFGLPGTIGSLWGTDKLADADSFASDTGNMYFTARYSQSQVGEEIMYPSPISRLHEYDIESIILKVIDSDSDWVDNGTEFVLKRDGAAYSTYETPTTEERWTVLFCGGGSDAKCAINSSLGKSDEVNYDWDTFMKYIDGVVLADGTLHRNCSSNSIIDKENSSIDESHNTNIFALRARFADENGEYENFDYRGDPNGATPYIPDSIPEPKGSGLEPFQFLGFEGGACDNTLKDGIVNFQIIFKLREYCIDVGLFTDSETGENKAWSGRINQNPTNSFPKFVVSGYKGVKFGTLGDNASFDNLYGRLDTNFSIINNDYAPFSYSQDNAPYGAIVPPTQTIYNPQKWDSRLDIGEDEFTGEQKVLEPDKQPLYVEKNSNQVRAGSPFSCEYGSQSKCIVPPEAGSPYIDVYQRSTINEADPSANRTAFGYIKQLFVKIYKRWIWNNSESSYILDEQIRDIGEDIRAGQCPVIMAYNSGVSFNINASNPIYYNLPIIDDVIQNVCPDGDSPENYGRYSINGKPALPESGILADIKTGQEVSLQFWAFNYNGEQLPLRNIKIEWGDGTTTNISSNFKNHRSDCKENSNYGQSSKACDSSPFEFKHIYTKTGSFKPILTITDNWGISTKTNYTNDLIEVTNELVSMDFSAFVAITPPAELTLGNNIFAFALSNSSSFGDSELEYKISLKKNYHNSSYQIGIPFFLSNAPDQYIFLNDDENLKSVILYAQVCDNLGELCGILTYGQATSNATPPALSPVDATPTIDIKANNLDGPIYIGYGTSATLTWTSQNATSCATAGGWSGIKPTSGTYITSNLTSSKTYIITCINSFGSSSDKVVVNVGPQSFADVSVNIKANGSDGPITVESGSSVNLTWASTNATSCRASGDWSNSIPTSCNADNEPDCSVSTSSLTLSKIYRITCSSGSPYSSKSDSVTVNVESSTTPPDEPPIPTGTSLLSHPVGSRYFVDSSGRAVYLTGSHTWDDLVDIVPSGGSPLSWSNYLNFIESHGANFLRLWRWEKSKWHVTIGETEQDVYISPNPYQRTGPGNANDGQPKFDLTKFNQAYFDRLRSRVVDAGNHGIYVGVMLFEIGESTSSEGFPNHLFNPANNINNINPSSGSAIYNLSIPRITEIQKAYVLKMIQTLGDLDNVLWEIGNEGPAYTNKWQNEMVNYIKARDSHPVGITAEQPDGGYSNMLASNADWISPGGGDTNFYSNPPVTNGSKVIISDSDHLFWPWDGITPEAGVAWIWKTFTRGHNVISMDFYQHRVIDISSKEATWDAIRHAAGVTLKLSRRVDLSTAIPSSSGYRLSSAGNYYIIFFLGGGSINVNLSGDNGTYSAKWIHPTSGAESSDGTISGSRTFTAPFSNAVLFLSKQSSSPPPSTTLPPSYGGNDLTINGSDGPYVDVVAGSNITLKWNGSGWPNCWIVEYPPAGVEYGVSPVGSGQNHSPVTSQSIYGFGCNNTSTGTDAQDWVGVNIIGSAPKPTVTIKVMAVGDSNTAGVGNPAWPADGSSLPSTQWIGYRKKLKELLSSSGINIDFVGSQSAGSYYFSDIQHEGYPGEGINKIQLRVSSSMLETYNPDSLLLLIGSNDMWTATRLPITASQAQEQVNKLASLVDDMISRKPNMNIIIAKPPTPTNAVVPLMIYRAGIDRIVADRKAQGKKIFSVDFMGAQNDGVHYTVAGHEECARRWFESIKAVLGLN